jgi:flagellar biosynthetic protein FlhB
MPGERTEQATPHRREKARREGDILVSRELTGAAALLAGVLALHIAAPTILAAWAAGYSQFLDLGRPAHWEDSALLPTLVALRALALSILSPVAGIAISVAATAFLVALAQAGGVTFHPQSITFKPDRINPLTNLKNLFSLRAAARLGKSMIPASIVVILAVQRIGSQLHLPPFSLERLSNLGNEVYGLLLAATIVLFGWSAIDYLVEWQSREQRLKMSREDMREEMKETEGNPQVRGRIRNLRRQMRRRQMKADISRAAVVITNPTHYAVALSFDFVTMEAPKVLAKGRNLIAEEMKAEARWAGVPILENPPLARSLYRSVEVGQPIPVELYATVASILAYLYRQRVDQELREKKRREANARHASEAGRAARNQWKNPPNRPGDHTVQNSDTKMNRTSESSEKPAGNEGNQNASTISDAEPQTPGREEGEQD